MSKLVFELTRDDLVAFNEWYLRTNPEQQAGFRLRRWGGALGIVVLGSGANAFFGSRPLGYALMLGVAVAFALYLPRTIRRTARDLVDDQLDGHDTRGLLGRRSLEITEDGLLESSELETHLTRWTAPIRIQEGPEYTVFVMQPGEALVVNKLRVVEGDLAAFAAEARRRVTPISSRSM